jgi:leucyl aminopeptidase
MVSGHRGGGVVEIAFKVGVAQEDVADGLIVPVAQEEGQARWARATAGINDALGGEVARLAADARFVGAKGATLTIPTLGKMAARRVVLTGVGSSPGLTAETIRRAWGAAAVAAREAGAESVVSMLPPSDQRVTQAAALAAAAEGVHLALYQFARHHGAGHEAKLTPKSVESVRFIDSEMEADKAEEALSRGAAMAAGVALARDLANEPASVLTPHVMADYALRVGEESGLEVEVLGPAELEAMGAGAILAVGRGSVNEPRLIRMRYQPADDTRGAGAETTRRVGLVGKCITFDTGGYSIKTYDGMLEMKGDMAGGAAVLGAMSALRAIGCPVAVDATICAAENMISGEAMRPGDVLTALNGVTIEVLSTDAEGRLVLADGLVDAARRGATELIDLATLTGAAVVALGEGTTALFASDDGLADKLLSAAEAAGERTWRMPLIDELNEKINGMVGDVKNTGGRYGGAVTAALFLQRFSEDLPWAHLDIAGSARFEKGSAAGPKGASGVGVRTLLTYLSDGGA